MHVREDPYHVHVLREPLDEGKSADDLVTRIACRDVKEEVDDGDEGDDLVHRLSGQIDAELRLVGAGLSEVRMVVDLKDDARLRGDRHLHGDTIRQERRTGARSPSAERAERAEA